MMNVNRCAFELQVDGGVQLFDYETCTALLTLSEEQVNAFLQWWFADVSTADIAKVPEVRALVDACSAFVETWEKSLQLEKTDVALRMAKSALEPFKDDDATGRGGREG